MEALLLYETFEEKVFSVVDGVKVKVQKTQIIFFNWHNFAFVSILLVRKAKRLRAVCASKLNMLGAGLPEIWSRKVPHRKNEWIGALLYLQGHIHKKFCIAVGGFRGAAVFFRDGCNRGKADAGSAVFGGTVSALAFPDVSVKAVGGDDIQSVSMADFRGEAEIPGLRADRPASGDGIFHEIPEQRRHVKLEKGRGSGSSMCQSVRISAWIAIS